MDPILQMPLLLGENRVFRVYPGGALLEAFRGSDDPRDGDLPEDWVGSVTPAVNPPGRSYPGEGLSTVVVDGVPVRLADLVARDPVAVAGPAIVERYGATTALLVKLLDAGRRLPVHAHPTREFARRVLGSPFGKAESWIVLATRDVAGQAPPRVWLGFRRDVGREELADWVARQDTAALLASLNEVPVGVGDAIFVRPGLPHAIGAGVFLAEVQEPTDLSIHVEHRGFPITPEAAHMGLGWQVALDCIDRRVVSAEDLGRLMPRPTLVATGTAGDWRVEDVLGRQTHGDFRAYRLTTRGTHAWPWAGRFGVVIVTRGSGVAETAYGALPLSRGDTLALLAATATTTFSGHLEMLVATPPEA